MKKWVEPSIDTSKWEFYDLSCKAPCIYQSIRVYPHFTRALL